MSFFIGLEKETSKVILPVQEIRAGAALTWTSPGEGYFFTDNTYSQHTFFSFCYGKYYRIWEQP